MFKSTKWGAIHTTLDGDSPSLTSLCWAQSRSRFPWVEAGSSIWCLHCLCGGQGESWREQFALASALRDAEGSEEQAANSEGQEWQQGMNKEYSPALCCPLTFFSNVVQPCSRKALHGCAWLLRRDSFVSVALLFISPFLSPLEGIVLTFLFTSLYFFECNSLFPLPPEHK